MAELTIERIKDDMGEVHIKVTADFVYWKEKDDIFRIREAFEETMARFAI